MTDDEFDAMLRGISRALAGQDPGPESNVRIYMTLFGLLVLFWGVVVLLAVAVIA